MRKITGVGAGLTIGLALIVGCGQEKQLPSEVQLPSEKEGSQAVPVPTKSQPEAVQLVDKILKAATDGRPERLERAKANVQTAKGNWLWPNNVVASATRTVQAVWPDRIRVTLDFLSGDIKQSQLGLHSPEVWIINIGENGPVEFNPPNRQDYEEIVAVDVIGHHWLPMLVPFVDPSTVVYGAKKETLGNIATEVLQISFRKCPIFSMWVDERTSLPLMIAYTHSEGGSKLRKQILLSKHKVFGGVQLPTELEFSRNGKTTETWTVATWDFSDKIDDATFNRPPEKK